jgi:hypothetical protein
MTVHTSDNPNTKINDIAPSSNPDEPGYSYTGINLLVPFTGNLTIVKDVIPELYYGKDLQLSISFKTVYELAFSKGNLLSTKDLSKEMEQQRVDGTLEEILADIPF